MKSLTAFAVLLAASASAAGAPKGAKHEVYRTAGKILQAQSKLSPSADGPKFREGRVTIFDKAEHSEEFKVTPKTKVTLDGKPAKFQNSSSVGTLVIRALYDPNTKELSSIDLKAAPKTGGDASKTDGDDSKFGGSLAGEIANTDIVKGVVSVRTAAKTVREYSVTDVTKIRRELEGTPGEDIALESVKIGESVEVHSMDGKTASELHVRAAR